MKCSLGISNFLEEISSLSHSVVFFYFFALITEEGFLISPCYSSNLTTSNLPWFMDLTFQVPMQYCSLQHRALLLSPVTSTAGCCFCLGSIPSFFLELFLHWSPGAYWAPIDLRSSSFSLLSFCLFIQFMGFSRQEYWSGLPFPLQWTTFCQTSPPWPDLLGWPHTAWLSCIELDKAFSMWSDWLIVCDCGAGAAAARRRAAERSYPTSKVRSGDHEEIPHVQDKRNPSKTVGAERGHQRADRLNPQSQDSWDGL